MSSERKIVLIVAAHPDDEVLGCGGSIAYHVAQGDEVHVTFMADGESSRSGKSHDIAGRNRAAETACQILGITSYTCLGLPDNRMDSMALLDIVQPLEQVIAKLQPTIIYTHHGGDLNIDHRLTYQAVMTACRPQPHSGISAIYSFEVVSSTEWSTVHSGEPFTPNYFVNISATLNKKLEALHAYDNEMRPWPHTRSFENVEALARYRGASIGVEAAEAFRVERMITR